MQDEIDAIARSMQELRDREDDHSKLAADVLVVQLIDLLILHVPERVAATAREIVAAYETVEWFRG